MRYATTAWVAAGFLSLLCFGAATPLHAQSAWLPPAEGTIIALEAYKAKYDVESEIKFATSIWFLSGQIVVGPKTALLLDVPFSYFDDTPPLDTEAESVIGNPYIGVSLGPYRDGFRIDIGARLPMADETQSNALLNGLYTDFYRAGAFLPEAATLRLLVSRDRKNASGTLISRSRAGVSIWMPTDLQVGRDLLFDSDINLWYRPGKLAVGGMFAWRFLMSASGGSFTQRSEFQLGAGATWRSGAVEPGIHARIPLGNEGLIGLGTLVNVIFGFNVTVHIQKPKHTEKGPPVGPRIGARDP